jgi:hypothetical protein
VESIAEVHVRLIRIVVVIRSQRKRCLNVLAHAASTCRSTITGSVNVKVEPWPGCDSTQIRPPCISMMRQLRSDLDFEAELLIGRQWFERAADAQFLANMSHELGWMNDLYISWFATINLGCFL